MLYELNGEVTSVDIQTIDPKKQVIGLITMEELSAYSALLHIAPAIVARCETERKRSRSMIDSYGDYSFGIFNIVDVRHPLREGDRVGFYLAKNIFLLVDLKNQDNMAKKMFSCAMEKANENNISIEKLIYLVLETIISDDYEIIEDMEFELAGLEELITKGKANDSFNSMLLNKKKKLLVLHNYYEQLATVAEELIENHGSVFDDNKIFYFDLFKDRALRLDEDVTMMREGVVQLREAYASAVDLNINKIMRVLTVVTTIFMPLTLITGWYGMNFVNMPELQYRYGYIIVSVLSALIVGISILICKKKKFF